MKIATTPQIVLEEHPLFKKLTEEKNFKIVTPENFEESIKTEGLSLFLFIENPNRMKETLDALVIAPEVADGFKQIQNRFVVVPPNARKLAVAYGFKRWPALVVLKDGAYLGAVDGLRLWGELVKAMYQILNSQPKYPPSIGIPVRAG